ncbi:MULTISPECIES: DNA polymerase ligase N-terminal domain-containing protein [Mycobacterium ulcerans group]|uniref:DNA ligase D 3'-phosphoesterase domain-containing protein n=2 Tax=Mycobacterium ulcerans group TaxID=2993898 RepID=B2HQZ9_MYCMM|nr:MULTISPECIES: DNA polymerase ligase N-terminal domain-containing protein [Mycobacterium ulcerans group]ACC40885.1 conserved hypothetical protein [Mycobacterium marinum M]MDC8974292.1 DNA polymerase ligase N-terminal domain-containing protein [Mycobacterium marinum]MDC9017344.1 DNA polymerase ligase N-terminal domain-containing protein [Mycobacterium marinum]QYL28380.1 Putative DNA ligase-like protein [Mycobacterium shottsii]BBX58323.1 hypothetical protein MSHO_36680 [Mycobacterium shottsii]
MPLRDNRHNWQSDQGVRHRGRRRWKKRKPDEGPRFVVQHHAAGSGHYDFRLEIGGVLVSWAIPSGPSTNPEYKRMARRTENHPVKWASSKGVIPDAACGAGAVVVWDQGTYANRTQHEMTKGLDRGHLSFHLHGQKLRGGYALTRIREGSEEAWLLVKRSDDHAVAPSQAMGNEPESP